MGSNDSIFLQPSNSSLSLTASNDTYRQAIKLKPDFADAWGNLGNALQDDVAFKPITLWYVAMASSNRP
jgi:hypothetical protein